MKTTIEIDEPLLREAKQLAARDGTSLRALVEQGLRQVVIEGRPQKKPREWRIKPFHGQGWTDEFKNASWSKIRSAAYGMPDDE